MAGDYYPIQHGTNSKPEVAELAVVAKTIPKDLLYVFAARGIVSSWFEWVDAHTDSEEIKRATPESLARATMLPVQVIESLTASGWLSFDESGARISNWDRWFSKSAKVRMNSNRRVAKHRASVTNVTEKRYQSVTNVAPERYECNASALQKALPEKRREEINTGVPVLINPLPPLDNETNQRQPKPFPDPLSVPIPGVLDSAEFREAWQSWWGHLAGLGKQATDYQAAAQLKDFVSMGRDRAMAAMLHSIRNGWANIREPREDSHNGHARQPKRRAGDRVSASSDWDGV